MKKTILFTAALLFNILISCGTKDEKNEVEPYPNYDTTSRMENINDPDSAASSQNGAGDMENKR